MPEQAVPDALVDAIIVGVRYRPELPSLEVKFFRFLGVDRWKTPIYARDRESVKFTGEEARRLARVYARPELGPDIIPPKPKR